MKEMLGQPGKLGSSGPFYEQPKEGVHGKNKGNKKREKQGQELTSLAELSRRMLRGELHPGEYLNIERQLSPRFGELWTTQDTGK